MSKLVCFPEQFLESPLKLTPYFVEHDVDRPSVLLSLTSYPATLPRLIMITRARVVTNEPEAPAPCEFARGSGSRG